MAMQEIEAGKVTVLVVNGRVDSSNAIDLSNRLRELFTKRARRVVLDLQELEYITSAGFRSLMIAVRHAKASGGQLVLCSLTQRVRELFSMGGFLDQFAIQPTREHGVASLA